MFQELGVIQEMNDRMISITALLCNEVSRYWRSAEDMRLSFVCLSALVFSEYYLSWDHDNVSSPFKGHSVYGEKIMLHVNRIAQGRCEVGIEFWCLANQRWIAKRPNEF